MGSCSPIPGRVVLVTPPGTESSYRRPTRSSKHSSMCTNKLILIEWYCRTNLGRPTIHPSPVNYIPRAPFVLVMCLFMMRRAMLATQVALTSAVAFLAAVNGISLTQVPFYEAMPEGDSVVLAEHGPFIFSTSCGSSVVTNLAHQLRKVVGLHGCSFLLNNNLYLIISTVYTALTYMLYNRASCLHIFLSRVSTPKKVMMLL